MKRVITSALVLIILLTTTFSVSASTMLTAKVYDTYGTSSEYTDEHTKTIILDKTVVNKEPKINTFDKKELKEKWFKKFNQDPEKNKIFIENIDTIVDLLSAPAYPSSEQPDNSIQFIIPNFPIKVSEEWIINPYQYETIYGVTYRVPWLSIDNYNGSGTATFGVSGTISTSANLGFSSSSELTASEAGKFGLVVTGSYSRTASYTYSSSFTIPAWTYWGIRTYVYWIKNNYKGYLRTLWYNGNALFPEFYTEDTWEYASNSYDWQYGSKTWTAYNSAHDNMASHPNPPTNWPWDYTP